MEAFENPLEKMPIEVVAVIAQYLRAKDLGACCATSNTMRELFGDDIMWRPRCNKELVEYLRITPCKVQPAFVIPDFENSTLSPMSKWRLSFMYENHLWNNWRKGKSKEEELGSESSRDKHSICDVFYSNDLVISLYKSGMKILDVRAFPAQEVTEDVNFATEFSDDVQVKVENNVIITLFHSGVQVYNVDLAMKECSLKYVFFCEESKNVKFNSPVDVKEAFMQRRGHFKGMLSVLLQKFFIGCFNDNSLMHIWDISNGIKLKEEGCPVKNSHIVDIKGSKTLHLVIAVKHKLEESTTIFVYSLNTLKFLPFRENVSGHYEYSICSNFVGIVNNNVFNVHNYQTSEVILKDHANSSHPQTFKENFLFLQNDVLKVFKPITQTTESLLYEITRFETLRNRFVQVYRSRMGEIWEVDVENGKVMKISTELRFTVCDYYLNKASTRYIVRWGISGSLIHFW